MVRKKLDQHHSRASSVRLEATTTRGYAHLLPRGVGRGGMPSGKGSEYFFFILATPRAQGNTKMKNQTVKHSSIPLPPLPSRMLLQTRKSGPPPTSHSHHTGQAMGLWYPPVESSGFVPPVQTNYQSVTSHGPLIHDPSMYRILFLLLHVIIKVIFFSYNTYSRNQNTCVINFSVFLASHAVYILRPHHISIGFDSISDFIQP